MFEYNNREYRSLQEQVKFNTEKIAEHYKIDRVLADLGIKIMGQVNTAEDLPDAPPGGAEAYGEAYAVGTEAPYNIYIWTRPDETHPDAYWFDIGAIAIKGDKGDPGTTISRAVINPDNQLVLTMTDGSTITVPGNLKGATGPSPKIYLSNVEDGVQIRVENPDGTASYTTVKNGINGQNGAQGNPGPPGYFNVLGTLANQGQLPSASSVSLGSAYLVWHAIAEEENGGHYDLWLNINGAGGQVWQNTGRVAAGTYIYQGGQVINEFNADSKVDKITTSTGYRRVYGIGPTGNNTFYNLSSAILASPTLQIVCRDTNGNGQITVPETPIYDSDATSKMYVDNRFALYQHNIAFTATYNETVAHIYFTLYSPNDGYIYDLDTNGIINAGGYIAIGMNNYPITNVNIQTFTSFCEVSYIDNDTYYNEDLEYASFRWEDNITKIL